MTKAVTINDHNFTVNYTDGLSSYSYITCTRMLATVTMQAVGIWMLRKVPAVPLHLLLDLSWPAPSSACGKITFGEYFYRKRILLQSNNNYCIFGSFVLVFHHNSKAWRSWTPTRRQPPGTFQNFFNYFKNH